MIGISFPIEYFTSENVVIALPLISGRWSRKMPTCAKGPLLWHVIAMEPPYIDDVEIGIFEHISDGQYITQFFGMAWGFREEHNRAFLMDAVIQGDLYVAARRTGKSANKRATVEVNLTWHGRS